MNVEITLQDRRMVQTHLEGKVKFMEKEVKGMKDSRLSRSYEKDLNQIKTLTEMVKTGNIGEASAFFQRLDTFVRDAVMDGVKPEVESVLDKVLNPDTWKDAEITDQEKRLVIDHLKKVIIQAQNEFKTIKPSQDLLREDVDQLKDSIAKDTIDIKYVYRALSAGNFERAAQLFDKLDTIVRDRIVDAPASKEAYLALAKVFKFEWMHHFSGSDRPVVADRIAADVIRGKKAFLGGKWTSVSQMKKEIDDMIEQCGQWIDREQASSSTGDGHYTNFEHFYLMAHQALQKCHDELKKVEVYV